jgi:two-component system phosphate regulon sensor histidine kinase PhoR
VTIAVRDTGEGIDPVHIPRLTERFYRVDSHRSREMGGTGLGLAIVRQVAVAHGGRVSLEEREGPGATFRLELPLRRTPPEVVRSLQAGYAPGYGPDTEAARGLGV